MYATRRCIRTGDVDEALVLIGRREPRLEGLARALARVPGLKFGPPASDRSAHSALDHAADWFERGDLVETVAQLQAFGGFYGLGRLLTAPFGA